ncbi:hypothetical protein C2G38_2204064 [Gigaspora rosea]|uniref:Uncharacterized protein n=1 Tax=Gigaspora rosea TaxID=44941 RepID=A0A397ULT5_9GLOM|nr:hypothetical protein C2G38_2204064 [Gigaspora rosea]
MVRNNAQNQYSDYLIVALLTSRNLNKTRLFELLIKESRLTKPSKILFNQIRNIDKEQRILEYLEKITIEILNELLELDQPDPLTFQDLTNFLITKGGYELGDNMKNKEAIFTEDNA